MVLRINSSQSEFFTDLASLLLRILFGTSLIINYGWPTFGSLMAGDIGYPDPLGIGEYTSQLLISIAQFFCAILLILGLFTRLVTLPVIIAFIVAFFVFHASDPFEAKELSYLYLSAFTAIFFIGGRRFSLDQLILNYRSIYGKRI